MLTSDIGIVIDVFEKRSCSSHLSSVVSGNSAHRVVRAHCRINKCPTRYSSEQKPLICSMLWVVNPAAGRPSFILEILCVVVITEIVVYTVLALRVVFFLPRMKAFLRLTHGMRIVKCHLDGEWEYSAGQAQQNKKEVRKCITSE